MKRKVTGALLTAWITLTPAFAQQTLTLKECLEMGIERNLQLQQKQNQISRSQMAVSERRASLLPQINGYFNLNDNFQPQTNVAYSKAGGVFAVSEMMQYNAAGGVQLSMPLYNQSLYTAINVQKLMAELSSMQYDKAREDLIIQIAQLYYLGQMTAEQIRLLDNNVERLTQLRDITAAMSENGMALEVDVQRIDINLKTIKVNRQNSESLLEQQLNTLKYVIDYAPEEQIRLSPIRVDEQPQVVLSGVSELLPELRMLSQQQALQESQIRLIKNGYLPSLSLTGSAGLNTFSDKFSGWLDGSSDHNKWYGNYGLGVSLQIPIFDGFSKKYRIRQAKVDLENARLNLRDTRQNLRKEYLNAVSTLDNNRRNYQEQLENLKLAESVYSVTSDRYREGLAGMTEVLQDEMSIDAAQNTYVSAHYNYRTAALTLLKLTGQLDTLMK